MYPGIVGKGMPLQAAHEKVIAEGACEPRKQWNAQRLDAVDLKIVDVFGVVAPQHRCALVWTQPVIALAEGDLVPQQMIREDCLLHANAVRRRSWSFRD